MWRIVQGSMRGLPDAEAFLSLINNLHRHSLPVARDFFSPEHPIAVARAPGRLDVMGGFADYSGSLVLEMPIREATFAAVQIDPSPHLRIVSFGADDADRTSAIEIPIADLARAGGLVPYCDARAYFARDRRQRWAAYVAGCFLVLMHERGLRFDHGARILIDSAVPEGKSVSSSAALEVATMQALLAASGGPSLAPREIALLCQKVENLVVGAPCGVMDQMTSVCGRQGQFVALQCQPAELQDPVPLPEEGAIWGIDSGQRHCIGGEDYTAVRVGAFMGYRIIAELAGLPVRRGERDQSVFIEDERWGGYLANITPEEFWANYAAELPERISGASFLNRFGGTTDHVTCIDPDRVYPVRASTTHPIYENARVCRFAELLRGPAGQERLESLGRLMYESHSSYSACGSGSEGTDRLVDMVRHAGPANGLYGAKITGGGCGGTVVVLGRRDGQAAVKAIAEAHARRSGYPPRIFTGSSPGAAEFGALILIAS